MSRRKFLLNWQHPALGRETELCKTFLRKSVSQPAHMLLRGKKLKRKEGGESKNKQHVTWSSRLWKDGGKGKKKKKYFEEVQRDVVT